MHNIILKISLSVLLVLATIAIAVTPVFADYLDPNSITPNDNGGVAAKTQTIAGTILAVAQVIGISVALIMLIVLAIKYISAAPNDKAEIKKHAVIYIVGAVVLFAGSGILGIISGFANQIK
jgi:uncharacterized membrane protein